MVWHKIDSYGRPGMTLIEVLVTMAVFGLLALLIVPTMSGLVPAFQLRSSARGTATIMEQARLMAHNYQKPVRMVMDCRDRLPDAAASLNPCIASLYVAVFDETNDGQFKEWRKVNSDGAKVDKDIPESGSRLMGAHVNIQAQTSPASVPVTGNPDGLFWAVFFPTGRLAASHSPMVLDYTIKGRSANWQVSLNNASGQVTVKKTL